MKKLITFASAFLAAASLFAANTGYTALMEFYTSGPDTYADGTPVVVGETYLFVYVPANATFGIDTQGELQGGAVKLGQAAAWKDETGNVRCPYTPINYSTKEYPADGTFQIVLLDTRINATTAGGFVDGYTLGDAVAATCAAGTIQKAIAAANAPNEMSAGSAAGSAKSLLDAATDTPVIKAVETADGAATVTIDNTRARGSYTVVESTTLDGGWQPTGADKVQNQEGTATVKVPASSAKVRFFKVICK